MASSITDFIHTERTVESRAGHRTPKHTDQRERERENATKPGRSPPRRHDATTPLHARRHQTSANHPQLNSTAIGATNGRTAGRPDGGTNAEQQRKDATNEGRTNADATTQRTEVEQRTTKQRSKVERTPTQQHNNATNNEQRTPTQQRNNERTNERRVNE